MVVCKDKRTCNYIVLCNRVLTSTTSWIKTLFHKHKCGRQFFNKSVKVEWDIQLNKVYKMLDLGMQLKS